MVGFASEAMNLGLGARVGKTFDNHVSVSGELVYHLGASSSFSSGGVSGSASSSVFYVGPALGYDFVAGPVVIRPYLGFGMARFSASSTVLGQRLTASDSRFVAWPGGQLLYGFRDSAFFLGGDLRVVTVPGGSFGLFGFGGMHFGS